MHAFAMIARVAIAAQSAAPGAQPAPPTAQSPAPITQAAPPHPAVLPAASPVRRPLIHTAAPAATVPADSPGTPPPDVPRVPKKSLLFEAYPGAGSAGVLLGADVLGRYRFVEGGVLGQLTTNGLFNSMSSAAFGGALGVATRGTPNEEGHSMGGDLLGVFGTRGWSGVGGSGQFWSNQGGVSGSLLFAGVRAGGSWYMGHFAMGMWLGVDDDLGRQHVSYTYNDSSGFNLYGGGGGTTKEVEVGAVTVFLALRLGENIDFM